MTSQPTVANVTFVKFSVCDKDCNTVGCSLTISQAFSSDWLGISLGSKLL
jgi:hypothetical protein